MFLFLIGLRWILSDIPRGEDPLRDLAHAYLEDSSYSPVQHDLRKRKEDMLIARIRAAGGEAAIVTAAKMCEPGLEEQVAYIHGLEREEIGDVGIKETFPFLRCVASQVGAPKLGFRHRLHRC